MNFFSLIFNTLFMLSNQCFIQCLNKESSALDWGYFNSNAANRRIMTGKEWGKKYHDCDKKTQSPINIVTNNSIYDPHLKAIKIVSKHLESSTEPHDKEKWLLTNKNHNGN